jgi:hypothetical protein
MVKKSGLTLAGLGVLVLCACSSTEPQQGVKGDAPPAPAPAGPTDQAASPAGLAALPEVPSERAVVTVYRKKQIVGMALHASVHVDKVEVAELENGAYIRIGIPPGPHMLYADEEKDAIQVDLKAGKEHYYRMGLAAGLWKGHGKLEPVDESTGAAEFKEWTLKLTKEIRKPEIVLRDPGKP